MCLLDVCKRQINQPPDYSYYYIYYYKYKYTIAMLDNSVSLL